MQHPEQQYDAAIIGGGLAGLSLAIQLVRKGFQVILFEKEVYPFHKVCGEYISKEAWSFLEGLGVPLTEMRLPIIDSLMLTAPNGSAFKTKLPLGGFGISRYTLDYELYKIATLEGVVVKQGSRVDDVVLDERLYTVHYSDGSASRAVVTARICMGAFGKRSNLDVKWKRTFINSREKGLNNYIAVKYHVTGIKQPALIGLHNFENGYCGVSEIEEGKYCLCYLTTAATLKKAGGQIGQLEKKVLSKNPVLATLLTTCSREESFPVTIAQISFSRKTWVENGVLMLGDAAGMITPLCGNGMSMALHSSKMMAVYVEQYLKGAIDFNQLILRYKKEWLAAFGSRMQMGRLLQRFFGRPILSNFFVGLFRILPLLARPVIQKTHGQPF